MEKILHEMNKGEIYKINDKQLFFKLQMNKNHQKFWIIYHNNVRSFQRNYPNYVVHENDRLALLDYDDHYELHLQIPTYVGNNSQFYLFNMKEGDKKCLLTYGMNNNIQWDKYKSNNNEVLFYLKKK